MRLRPEELELARAYTEQHPFEGLTKEQLKLIMDRGRGLHHWFKSHQAIHFLINLTLVTAFFVADYFILLRLPPLLLRNAASTSGLVLSALVVGVAHGWLMYSLTVFSIHEGAAHKIIFPLDDQVNRALNRVAWNLCRIAAADPEYYSEHHMSHHAKFGTAEDGEFLNFVTPRRYYLTLLPFANTINYSDFIAHRPLTYTHSRLLSAAITLLYHGVYGYLMARSSGVLFMLTALLLFVPHVGFSLDRLRQYSEHNLMPLENKDGSRSFGLGFWGMVIGGGPWGSPCHWEHHLVPSLPWYQQLVLHRYVVKNLTPRQKKEFLLQPVIGFPKLFLRLLRESERFRDVSRQSAAMDNVRATANRS